MFSLKFKQIMEKRGHQVSFSEPRDYDVLFLIVQCPFDLLIKAKQMQKKVIQRLDGVYYWSISGPKFPLWNAKSAIIKNFFADYLVFQSKYSQHSAERFLGNLIPKPSTIIYNGVDTELFSNRGNSVNLRDNLRQEIIFSASEFRYRSQIDTLLESFRCYQSLYNANAKLVLVGSFSGEVAPYPQIYQTLPRVQFVGPIPNSDLPRWERGADLFVFSHLNPPCPNNIIEAMSCGLPICGINDGSMGELCDPSCSRLLKTTGNGYWCGRKIDPGQFAANMNFLLKNKRCYSTNSRKHALTQFSLAKMGEEYEKMLQQVIL